MSWHTGLPVAHKLHASSHEFPCRQNFDRSGVEHHACSHLRAGMSAVEDHKANTSLTELAFGDNNVGDAGAAALAQAVRAMVLTCELYLFQGTCFLLPQMSRYTVVLAVGVVRLLCDVCVLLLCFVFCLEEKHSLVRKVLKVDVARFPNRLRQLSSLAIGTCSSAVRHHSASTGLWRSLSNYDRDVVPEGIHGEAGHGITPCRM